MKGFKGFDKNLKCNGFQYAIGTIATHKGTAELCSKGLHFCENPLDVLSYYGLKDGNRYAEVEADGVTDEKREDSKRVATSLKIGAELSIKSLVEYGIKFVFEKVKTSPATSGYSAHSATSGDSAHSATSGYSAHSATSGDYAHSATSGDYAHSATSGYSAHSATSGDYAHSAAMGKNAIAAAIGRNSKAKAALANWIVLSEYDEAGIVKSVKTTKVDGKNIKADTYYRLKNGKFIEAK